MEEPKKMKSNMNGAVRDYTDMFKQIMNWGEPMGNHNDLYAHGTHIILGNQGDNYIYDLGYSIRDMEYHGWQSESASKERDIYEKVSTAYYCLVKSLAEAIGYDYEKCDPESSMYKYHLKDLNVDDILKWKSLNSMEK